MPVVSLTVAPPRAGAPIGQSNPGRPPACSGHPRGALRRGGRIGRNTGPFLSALHSMHMKGRSFACTSKFKIDPHQTRATPLFTLPRQSTKQFTCPGCRGRDIRDLQAAPEERGLGAGAFRAKRASFARNPKNQEEVSCGANGINRPGLAPIVSWFQRLIGLGLRGLASGEPRGRRAAGFLAGAGYPVGSTISVVQPRVAGEGPSPSAASACRRRSAATIRESASTKVIS